MPAVTYKYDALGRRVARIKGSEWTRYTYDGDDVVLDENSNGSLVYYGNGPGIDNKLWYQQGSSSPVFFLTDHLGSTRALVSSTGSIIGTMDYDSFGRPLGQIATRYQYAGREWDPDTELYYYRARWYDPQARRFISEDPIGLNGGINLYAYVGNNAVNLVDPLGLWSPGAHDEIIRHGLGNMFSSQDLMKVQSYGRAFDKATQDTPFLHSMRAKGQSIEDANKDKAKFVRDALNRARQAEKCGNHEKALQLFANATHPLEDSTSPSHVTASGEPREWRGGIQWAEHAPWIEGPKQLTRGILQKTDALLQNAYEQVFGEK